MLIMACHVSSRHGHQEIWCGDLEKTKLLALIMSYQAYVLCYDTSIEHV